MMTEKPTVKADKTELNSGLLAVRSALTREYLPLAARLPEHLQPDASWQEREVLPTLVLLPTLGKTDLCLRAEKLALAMELCYLAGRVHDLAAAAADADGMYGRSILIGDYLYAAGAVQLVNAGFDGRLGKVGRILSRRAEARLVSERWNERAYVPESEKIANLAKDTAEGFSLAASMAADLAELSAEQQQAYTEFGFYLGVLQGISLNGYRKGAADEEALAYCRRALLHIPACASLAEEMLLSKLAEEKSVSQPKAAYNRA